MSTCAIPTDPTGPVWHIDPGHGWLQVPLDSCEGLPLHGIYVKGRFAFLEEDCEAAIWMCRHGYIDGEITVDSYPRVAGFTRWLIGSPDDIPAVHHNGRFPDIACLDIRP